MSVSAAAIANYWDINPCSEGDQLRSIEDERFYPELEVARYDLQPFIPPFAAFETTHGKRVLEIGVGLGADHVRFARAGALAAGVDVTWPAILHTRRRFRREGRRPRLVIGDALRLPFRDERFDVEYSFGVLHHTPAPPVACSEAGRVVKRGGSLKLMLYNLRSIVTLQVWLVFGLLRGRPFRSWRDLIANHMESPGTQAYTRGELRRLLPRDFDARVDTAITPYDCRVGRRRYLPKWMWKLIPSSLGWNHLITATRKS
jgi:SAM-dependent methyltransferase